MVQVAGGSVLDDEYENEPGEGLEDNLGGEGVGLTGEGEDGEVSIEDRARAMGWHPLSEFKGDPRRWTPAAEFIAKGEQELPILRDQNRRMSEKLARMEPQIAEIPAMKTTIAEMNQALVDMRNLARKADERGYQRALTELKEQRREAVASGDTETFEQIEAQIDELESTRAEVVAAAPARVDPPPAPPPAAAPTIDPAITAFISRDDVTPWWNRDEGLTRAMIAQHETVKVKHPTLPLRQQLDLALQRLKSEFPEHFDQGAEEAPDMADNSPNPRPRTPASPVAAPTRRTPPPRQSNGWDRITDPSERAEARAAFDRMHRLQPDMSEAEYLEIYLNPHADVLDVQRRAK